uniref:Uncharacterized protein n=1 Tax=Romanomermis culicivorax TaxID=13658 RepID=A0A915I6Q7_ROMCU
MRGGREAAYSDPAVCAVHKCPLQSAHKATNICCIHGIQTKTTTSTENGVKKEEEKTKATNGRPADEKNGSAAAMIEASKEEALKTCSKSHTQLLKDLFEKSAQDARAERNGVVGGSHEAEKGDSWFRKACKWISFSKPTDKEKLKVDDQIKRSGRVACRPEAVPQGPPPPPPPPPALDTKPKLKEVEPQYPLSLFVDRNHMSELKEKINTRALELDAQRLRPNVVEMHFASPQPPRMGTKPIYVAEIRKAGKLSGNEEEEEEEEEAEVIKKNFPAPAVIQQPLTFYQVPQKTRLIIRTTYEDDNSKNVQIIKKDWSEDGKNSIESVPLNAYRPTGINHGILNSWIDGLSDAVHAAASRKKQNDAQLLEQVRTCKNIVEELKHGPPLLLKSTSSADDQNKQTVMQMSPKSRAQFMFLQRKNRMQNWIISSKSSKSKSMELEETSAKTVDKTNKTVTSLIVGTQAGLYRVIDRHYRTVRTHVISKEASTMTQTISSTLKESSHQSTNNEETENMDHLPKKLRNPMGEIHDYQNMSKEYGDHLLTNIARKHNKQPNLEQASQAITCSLEKCHELSNMLSSDKEAEKSVELFHRRRQRAEQYVVDNENFDRTMLPPMAPTAKKPVNAINLYEATLDAASAKVGGTEQGPIKRPVESPVFRQVDYSFHGSPEACNASMATGRHTPAFDHQRLFSPVPFSKASGSRAYTPVPTDFLPLDSPVLNLTLPLEKILLKPISMKMLNDIINVWETGLLRDLRGLAKELALRDFEKYSNLNSDHTPQLFDDESSQHIILAEDHFDKNFDLCKFDDVTRDIEETKLIIEKRDTTSGRNQNKRKFSYFGRKRLPEWTWQISFVLAFYYSTALHNNYLNFNDFPDIQMFSIFYTFLGILTSFLTLADLGFLFNEGLFVVLNNFPENFKFDRIRLNNSFALKNTKCKRIVIRRTYRLTDENFIILPQELFFLQLILIFTGFVVLSGFFHALYQQILKRFLVVENRHLLGEVDSVISEQRSTPFLTRMSKLKSISSPLLYQQSSPRKRIEVHSHSKQNASTRTLYV